MVSGSHNTFLHCCNACVCYWLSFDSLPVKSFKSPMANNIITTIIMGAPIENQFWKLRRDISEDGKKLSIEEILDKAQEYIDYCISTPLIEVDFRGKDAQRVQLPKMRAMHIKGLCHHLGIVHQTWKNWREDQKYLAVLTRIEELIYVYKYEGAAAGMLNQSIIARDLGLVDKKAVEKTKIKVTNKDLEN